MNKLINVLKDWDHYQVLLNTMEFHGYDLPKKYRQAVVVATEGKVSEIELIKYQEEMTKELVRSGGTTNSLRRIFVHPNVYRSVYLDELNQKIIYTDKVFSLNPTLNIFKHIMTYELNSSPVAELFKKTMSKNQFELVDRHALAEPPYWSNTKREFFEIAQEVSKKYGFIRKKNDLIKITKHNIVFCCEFDLGGRKEMNSGPHTFKMYHLDEPENVLWLGKMYDLVQGVWYYQFMNGYQYQITKRHVVYSLNIYFQLFDTLFKTVDEL